MMNDTSALDFPEFHNMANSNYIASLPAVAIAERHCANCGLSVIRSGGQRSHEDGHKECPPAFGTTARPETR